MPPDSASSPACVAQFASRVDLIAAEAFEAGLDKAAIILANMAALLRSLSGDPLMSHVEDVHAGEAVSLA